MTRQLFRSRQRVCPKSALKIVAVCGLLLISLGSAQAAIPAQAQSGIVPLTTYQDNNVSFLYPKAWFKQSVSGDGTLVILSNDNAVLKAESSSKPPILKDDQIVLEVVAGSAVVKEIQSYKAANALGVLTNLVKGASGTIHETPEAIKLINSTDVAEVSATDSTTQNEEVLILIAPNDQPVIIAGISAAGQSDANKTIVQGIASTVQTTAGASSALSTPAATVVSGTSQALTETFSNSVYTINYPSGWLASSPSSDQTSVYLATDQSLIDSASSGQFKLTSGQVVTGVASGDQVYSISRTTASKAPSVSDILTGVSTTFTSGSSAIFSKTGKPSTIKVGTENGVEVTVILKSGGDGYLIVFYQGKTPILFLGLAAKGEGAANKALFEQMAASIVLANP